MYEWLEILAHKASTPNLKGVHERKIEDVRNELYRARINLVNAQSVVVQHEAMLEMLQQDTLHKGVDLPSEEPFGAK